ncbi:pentapeptide repeat-containing protein [Sciscionella marina]|uniref:pentapeptide repeat-containing protein n=1 Tax=Sciscionella marina TaxID=508770 RepID=UPI00036FBFAA|nr:pentapeptide repeat-containing protein [Sciscionella marina]
MTPQKEPYPRPLAAPLTNRMIAFTGLVLIVFAVAIGIMLPWLFGGSTPADRGRLEAIRVAGTIVVGAGGLVALWLAARRQRSTELELSRQYAADRVSELDAVERRITELYTKAADQLGSEKAPVRLAGLYALERVGSGAPDQRPTVVNVICAYLRMPFTEPGSPEDAGYQERVQEREVRLTAQRILHRRLTTAAGQEHREDQRWSGLTIDLTGAELSSAEFARADLSDAIFTGAKLGAADFTTAKFDHTNFAGADLRDADLASAQSMRADFTEAELELAVLANATLREANFSHARLDGANLSGTDLTGAVLRDAELGSVLFTEDTRWPSEDIQKSALAGAAAEGSGYRAHPDWRP